MAPWKVTLIAGACLCFATANTTAATTRFAVLGDFGDVIRGSDKPLLQVQTVADLINSWEVDCIVTVGDNFYEYIGTTPPAQVPIMLDRDIGQYYRRYIGAYQGAYGPGSTRNRMFLSPGNHDWGNETNSPAGLNAYLAYFALPGAGITSPGLSGNERYFDCIQGNVHFFLLDSDDSETHATLAGNTWNSTQGNWLKNALATSKTTYPNLWRVILFHHPPFTSDSGSQRPNMRWPFRVWGADLVFHGHAHHYERLTFDGIFYVTEGTGGSSVSASFGTTSSQSITASQNGNDFGATLVEATETALTLTHWNSGYARTTQPWDTVTLVRNSVDGVLDRLVGRGSDDAEETTSSFITSEPLLDIANNNAVTDKMTTGLRFTNVFIPQGATITRAFVQFKATNAPGSATPNPVVTIKGHKVANSTTFDAANKVIPRYDSQATTASATWTVLSWSANAAGASQRSPELATIIQEITSQGTWVNGNALTILLRRTTAGGNRWAHGFESAPLDGDAIQRQSGPPILHVEWINPLALVNVGTKDADAAETDPSDTASFTISRTGPTTSALTVNYAFSGAVGDYTVLPPATLTSISIPAGSSSVHVTNRANADATVEMPFETLTLTLSPGSYNVGPAGSATVAIHDIRPPRGLKAASGDNQVALTWNPVSGATAYKIWRSTVSGSYSTSLQTVTATNFTDVGVNNATTYYYVITSAKDSSDSVFSREIDVTPLAPIQNLSVTPGSGQQTINWSTVAGAEWYHVKRYCFSYSTNFRAAGPPFTDTSSGAGYFYEVTPIKGGSEGPLAWIVTSGLGYPAGVTTTPWAMVYLRAGVSPAPFPSVAIDPELTTRAYSIYAPVSGATVTIVSGFDSSEDVLDFTTLGSISGTYANGTLTLSGSGYFPDYEAALRTVRYRNLKRTDATNPGPNNGTRVVRFIMNEGAFPGDPAYRQIRVKSSNTAPLLTSVNTFNSTEDTPLPITYAALYAASVGASDANVDALQFRVGTVTTGTLTKNGVPVTANSTTLGPGETWFWTPALNARNLQQAFTVTTYDGWAPSTPARQVSVNLVATHCFITATDPVALEYGTSQAVFTVTRTGGTGEEVEVTFVVLGTATPTVDYYPITSSSVHFVPGQTSAEIPVYFFTDATYEPDETIIVNLTSSPNYLIGNASATITIYSYAKLLPSGGDSSSIAYAIGNYGQMVGVSSAASSRAVSWSVPYPPEQDLAASLLTVPSTLVNNTVAAAMGSYRIVGWGNNSSGNLVAFYSDGTVPGSDELPGLTHPNRKALAITRDDAWAVGLAHVDAANSHACLWDFSTAPPTIMDLGTYSEDLSSAANDVNNWTWFAIVGDSSGAAGTTPVLWRDFWSLAEALPTPAPDNNGSAQGVNDNDKIVGYTWVNGGNGVTRAVRWDSDGFSYTPTVLPLPTGAPSGASAKALKINNNNVIVGYASDSTFAGGHRAIVWINDVAYFLNDIATSPNINYTIAHDIHDNGRIVGQMLNNNSPQGFMLHP